jgi:hypothetical protein
MHVVAGHGRPQACQFLGITEEPTISLEHLTGAHSHQKFGTTQFQDSVDHSSRLSSSNEFQYTGRENEGNRLYFYRARLLATIGAIHK